MSQVNLSVCVGESVLGKRDWEWPRTAVVAASQAAVAMEVLIPVPVPVDVVPVDPLLDQ